jgi:hypothetical protein
VTTTNALLIRSLGNGRAVIFCIGSTTRLPLFVAKFISQRTSGAQGEGAGETVYNYDAGNCLLSVALPNGITTTYISDAGGTPPSYSAAMNNV